VEDAVGFDLGQLLVGLAHAGRLPAAALPATHEVLVPSYLEGYRASGGTVHADQVMRGYVLALMLRSGFASLPFEALGGPATGELYELARDRAHSPGSSSTCPSRSSRKAPSVPVVFPTASRDRRRMQRLTVRAAPRLARRPSPATRSPAGWDTWPVL